jgi:hypothetical protein
MMNDTGTLTPVSVPTWRIRTLPVVVPVGNPNCETVTVNVCGVVTVPEGETESHGARDSSPVEAGTVTVVGVGAVTRIVCESGLPWIVVVVKVNDVGATVNVVGGGVGELTVRVTGTVTVPAAAIRLILPLNVPAVSPVSDTEALMVAVVVRLPDGEIESQLVGADVAEAVIGVGEFAKILMDWLAGWVPPAVAVKLSDVGVTVNIGGGGGCERVKAHRHR